jgi:hypothetical protein
MARRCACRHAPRSYGEGTGQSAGDTRAGQSCCPCAPWPRPGLAHALQLGEGWVQDNEGHPVQGGAWEGCCGCELPAAMACSAGSNKTNAGRKVAAHCVGQDSLKHQPDKVRFQHWYRVLHQYGFGPTSSRNTTMLLNAWPSTQDNCGSTTCCTHTCWQNHHRLQSHRQEGRAAAGLHCHLPHGNMGQRRPVQAGSLPPGPPGGPDEYSSTAPT